MPDVGLMSRINEFLLSKVSNPGGGEITEDFFPGEAPVEVMCRHDPSPVIKKRYLTGGRWQDFNFSYYVASNDVIQARQLLEAFQTVLFLDSFAGFLGVSQGRLVPVSAPVPVSKDQSGRIVYSSSYRLEFFEGGSQ